MTLYFHSFILPLQTVKPSKEGNKPNHNKPNQTNKTVSALPLS